MNTSDDTVWIGSIDHDHLGPIWVAVSSKGLLALRMRASETEMREQLKDYDVTLAPERIESFLAQVKEYFEGQRRQFEMDIDWSALSSFQAETLQTVWRIPYGATRTYQDIADDLGKPGAARAVGRANATNPIPIIIPCHRVLGSDGSLHGYGGPGGVETKAWLLRLEGSRLL